MSVVELAPVVKSIDVRRSAADAFRIFTQEIAAWWPLETHTRAKTAEGQRTVRVMIEPRVGGRIYETLETGEELEWGEVRAWEPGSRFAMGWRLGRPVEQTTDVSVLFEPIDAQSCRVTLTHENWERMGEEAERLRNAYNGGWVTVFEKGFGARAGLI
ncbi:MAG TPA: SRPBCC domain-containing protein [Candidatus Binatia bacterium]|nr:SRPBCC domain-containing protein [Candidatus Binatia bacterium]